MKKDDAVAILRGVANHLISGEEISYSDKVMLALDTAIKALKEVKNQNQELNNSNDLISRAAAIDAFMTATADGDKADWCKWVLEQLPSAQPEICEGCRYENADDGVLIPCGFCKRSHPDNYERRTDE